MVKCLSTMWETWVWSLGWEDSLEKEMATHSSTLALKIPWTEELGAGYYPRGLKELGMTEWLHLLTMLVITANIYWALDGVPCAKYFVSIYSSFLSTSDSGTITTVFILQMRKRRHRETERQSCWSQDWNRTSVDTVHPCWKPVQQSIFVMKWNSWKLRSIHGHLSPGKSVLKRVCPRVQDGCLVLKWACGSWQS